MSMALPATQSGHHGWYGSCVKRCFATVSASGTVGAARVLLSRLLVGHLAVDLGDRLRVDLGVGLVELVLRVGIERLKHLLEVGV